MLSVTTPAGSFPVATAKDSRIVEDQDLLERSTKKSKTDSVGPVNIPRGDEMEGVETQPLPDDIHNGFPAKPSYRDLVAGKRPEKPEDVELISDDEMEEDDEDPECPLLKVEKTEKARMRKPWKQSVIVKVFGRKIGYTYLARRLQSIWHPKAKMEVVALNEEYFLVRFWSIDDYEFAKYGGPWTVMDHYLIVQDWRPNFQPKLDKTERVLVWVRLPDLPIEYFDYKFLMRVGEKIGEPKFIDEATSLVSRGKFARICVEVDITKPLLSKYKLRRRVMRIEYEGIHMVCFNCGVYGHTADQCSRGNDKDVFPESEKTTGNRSFTGDGNNNGINEELEIRPEIAESFGPWMLAPKRQGRQFMTHKGKSQSSLGKSKITDKAGNSKDPVAVNSEKELNTTEFNAGNQSYIIGKSRYSVLGGEETNVTVEEFNEPTETNMACTETHGTRLRGKGKRSNVQISEKQLQNEVRGGQKETTQIREVQERHAAGSSIAFSRPKINRAADEEIHTVVRGWNKNKITTREEVNIDIPRSEGRVSMLSEIFEHHADPPDLNNVGMDEDTWQDCSESARTGIGPLDDPGQAGLGF